MPTITKLVQTSGLYPCMRVDLDGRYAFSLEPEVAMHLKEGQCLSEDELETLLRANERERAQAAALRALGHRPYSRQEMAQKLARKHFDEDTTAQVLANLTARGLLDDAEFARFWRDNRDAFRPRSRALVGLELRRKGVAVDAVNSATADMDDEASALQAGEKKAKTLKGADYDTFYRRLGDYLKRRGYNYEVIKVTINKLWQAQM